MLCWVIVILIVILIAFGFVLWWYNKIQDKPTEVSSTPDPPPQSDQWTEWFVARNKLPESDIAVDQWYDKNWNNGWGPKAAVYPDPTQPSPDIITIARYYIGLPYRHHHIPNWDPPSTLTGKPDESKGLDCSNFTAWIYNYGTGLKFTSDIHQQSEMYKSNANMMLIDNLNSIKVGNLLYFWRISGSGEKEISHVGVFSGYKNNTPYLIDSTGIGVEERPMGPNSWYIKHFSHAIAIS